MDTGFTRLLRPLADVESFLGREPRSSEAQAPGRANRRDVLLSTLAALPVIEKSVPPTNDAITAAIDENVGEAEFRTLLWRADAHDPGIVNGFDRQGFTPLTLAALRGDCDRLDLLLTCSQKIDVDQPDKRGNTPLIIAAAKGNYGILRRLLAAHADVTRENADGCSPLQMTLQCWDDHDRVFYTLTLEAQLEVLQSMMDKGGKLEQGARTILEAAYQKAPADVQAEKSRIGQILGKE
jgi:ankyrin repeat protein